MENRLKRIYRFLVENINFNKTVQENYYISAVTPYDSKKEKITSLLYHIAGTQSQPKIDKLAVFYRKTHEDQKCFESFSKFVNQFSEDSNVEKPKYLDLYMGMVSQSGWGKKTSALFTKAIYQMHNGNYREDLKVWDDVPSLMENDTVYLPVDAVILAIFNKLDNSTYWTFDKVNSILLKYFSPSEMEVWDDLWFWGYITQKGSGPERIFGWNENKYWVLKETDKNPQTIKQIESLCELFLSYIE